MKIDLKYYLSIFIRRSPYFIVLTALFTSIGISVAVVIPPEYSARATLLVESEQIPSNLASSTVLTQASEQLQIIEQRLMTRANLLDMANRLELFQDEDGDGSEATVSAAEIVDTMRDRTSFQATGTAARNSRTPASATILEISYRGSSSGEVADVANEFVTLVLQENVEIRTEQAGATLDFFEQEVERLGTELDTRSAQLLEFEANAGGALPKNLPFLRQRLADLQDTLNTRNREIAALEDQRQRLLDLFQLTGGVQSTGTQLTPLEQRLEAARQALSDGELIYSAQNPKLAILVARVAQLEKSVADQILSTAATATETEDDAEQPSREQSLLNAQLADIDSQIATLQAEIDVVNGLIADTEKSISEAPTNGVGLSKLQRDFDNIKTQYDLATADLSAAATGERIELLAKGQRITVIEQAVPPEAPVKPNRKLIAAAGMGAGMGAGLGLILLLELLNKSIRRPIELTNKLGITPIAVLPYMRTEREAFMRRLMVMGAVAFCFIIVPLMIFAIHTFVFPLDTILEPLLNRAGYSLL